MSSRRQFFVVVYYARIAEAMHVGLFEASRPSSPPAVLGFDMHCYSLASRGRNWRACLREKCFRNWSQRHSLLLAPPKPKSTDLQARNVCLFLMG
mmetsp:Transcript_101139/g.324938  ORF Transcript_101139/g.324938 Transcript_101139/m.324938 type:complete len:95 (+) Transcript_101139:1565-1849(+)